MNWQILSVILIIFLALLYIGRNLFRKAKSFSPESGCGNDCGCETKAKKSL